MGLSIESEKPVMANNKKKSETTPKLEKGGVAKQPEALNFKMPVWRIFSFPRLNVRQEGLTMNSNEDKATIQSFADRGFDRHNESVLVVTFEHLKSLGLVKDPEAEALKALELEHKNWKTAASRDADADKLYRPYVDAFEAIYMEPDKKTYRIPDHASLTGNRRRFLWLPGMAKRIALNRSVPAVEAIGDQDWNVQIVAPKDEGHWIELQLEENGRKGEGTKKMSFTDTFMSVKRMVRSQGANQHTVQKVLGNTVGKAYFAFNQLDNLCPKLRLGYRAGLDPATEGAIAFSSGQHTQYTQMVIRLQPEELAKYNKQKPSQQLTLITEKDVDEYFERPASLVVNKTLDRKIMENFASDASGSNRIIRDFAKAYMKNNTDFVKVYDGMEPAIDNLVAIREKRGDYDVLQSFIVGLESLTEEQFTSTVKAALKLLPEDIRKAVVVENPIGHIPSPDEIKGMVEGSAPAAPAAEPKAANTKSGNKKKAS